MKITGIICEYDPFHNGHEYLLRQAREGSDAVVCVMSGNATQRGGFAIADKYTRAEMALHGGADLVLELPYPFSSASAEYFASAGVAILSSVGAERICFGSECGNTEKLMKAADVALTREFRRSRGDEGTAEGYFEALEESYAKVYGESLSLAPNDILGVEYGKAIMRGKYAIQPMAFERLGDGFLSSSAGASPFASATALRSYIREKGTDGLAAYMPKTAVELLDRAVADKTAPVDIKRIESAVLSFFRLTSPEALADIAELGNGLEYRLCEAALKAGTLDEFFSLAATKKYTDSRIRRAVLFAMTGVMRHDLKTLPQYTTLLAVNAEGREVLSQLRKKENVIPVVTKPADGKSVSERQYTLSYLLDCLFTLAMPTPTEAGAFMRKGAIID